MDAVRKLEKRLGVGACGTVFQGFNEETGAFVAIKEIPYLGADGDDQRANQVANTILREIKILQRAHHPNLVQYMGVRKSDAGVQLIMEYVGGGSLDHLLQRCGRLREAAAKMYVRDILSGLAYLHDSMLVCHRDVKPANVLLTTEGRCKLTDFGVSAALQDCEDALMKTTVGTSWYMAPEVINGGAEEEEDELPHGYSALRRISFDGDDAAPPRVGYTNRADIWSLGVMVFEMMSGQRPFGADLCNPAAVMFAIANSAGHPPSLPTDVEASEELRSFLELCFIFDKGLRPSARELLAHPWLCGRSNEVVETARCGTRGSAAMMMDSLDWSSAQPTGTHHPSLHPRSSSSSTPRSSSASSSSIDEVATARCVARPRTQVARVVSSPPTIPPRFSRVEANMSAQGRPAYTSGGIWSADGHFVDVITHEEMDDV